MAREQRSDGCRFESRFGGGWLAANQFLAEGMCARQARRDKVELPARFWDRPRWKRVFLTQLRFANSLLLLYPVEAIIKALRTKEGARAYSLAAPWLDPLIAEECRRLRQQETLREQKAAPDLPPQQAEIEVPREGFNTKPSPLKRLRDLD